MRRGAPQSPCEETKLHNITIIGSGPAGYTAAIYAARADLAPIVFEGVPSGGALTQTTEVENFPGFPGGVQGPELMGMMRSQAERFGATLIADEADRFTTHGGTFTVGSQSLSVDSRAVILAMGSAVSDARPTQRDAAAAATVSPHAPPATGSSSRTRSWRSWAAETRRWRRRSSSLASPNE